MATENSSYNVLNHELVPKHILLSEEEEKRVLEKLNIPKYSLPKIKKSDAAIKALERSNKEEIQPGRIVKIIRKSETAGEFEAYRLVTEK